MTQDMDGSEGSLQLRREEKTSQNFVPDGIPHAGPWCPLGVVMCELYLPRYELSTSTSGVEKVCKIAPQPVEPRVRPGYYHCVNMSSFLLLAVHKWEESRSSRGGIKHVGAGRPHPGIPGDDSKSLQGSNCLCLVLQPILRRAVSTTLLIVEAVSVSSLAVPPNNKALECM